MKNTKINIFLISLMALSLLSQGCTDYGSSKYLSSTDHNGGIPGATPVVGSGLVFSNVTSSSLTVSWGPAIDDNTPTAQLNYKLVYSVASSDIDTIAEVQALTGASVILDWSANTISTNVAGLADSTQYYFSVLVKDSSGNVELYSTVGQTTGTTIPVIGAAISFANVDYTSLTVNWGAATDDVTPSAQLQYKLVMATSLSAINTIDKADALIGAAIVKNWTANTTIESVTGLVDSTQYYFAVLVRDAADNKAFYAPVGQITPTPPAQTNLLSHWKFDSSINDVFGMNDFSQQGDASLFSATTVKFGTESLSFNGTNQYLTSNVSLSGMTNFTMAGWVYLKSVPTLSASPPTKIGFWGQNDLIEMGLMYSATPSPQLRLCLWVAGSSNTCDTQSFPLQQWVHVAVTGSTTLGTQVFLNGIRVATSSNISGGSSSDKVNVGYGVWSPAGNVISPENFFHGNIDELAIWDRVLSDTEIADLANL